MLGDRNKGRSTGLWVLAAGAAGLAAGVALSRRGGKAAATGRGLTLLEQRVREAIDADNVLARRSLDVGALGDGIVELSGTVRDETEAERAVAAAQRIPGVRTVLNRLDQEIVEDHLADTRRRFDEGDPSLTETHWYGLRIGTGQRRQGHETDPDRPDDRVDIVTRELGVDRAVEQTSEPLDKVPTAVQGHSSKPAAPSDRDSAEHASHRRLGNAPDEPVQHLNPESGVHENVKIGTELSLEESGLEEELIDRGLEDRS